MFKQLRLDETKPIEHTGRQKEYNIDIIQTREVSKGSGGLSLRPFCQPFWHSVAIYYPIAFSVNLQYLFSRALLSYHIHTAQGMFGHSRNVNGKYLAGKIGTQYIK